MKKSRDRRRAAAFVVGTGLVAAAVATEVCKPVAERTGYGRVLGIVPYDFRPPTPARLVREVWRPDDERLFLPTVFGVGWSVNLAAATSHLRRLSGLRRA